jgi:hypothetical protein
MNDKKTKKFYRDIVSVGIAVLVGNIVLNQFVSDIKRKQ